MSAETLFFWLFAGAALSAALFMVLIARNWISGVMSFVVLAIALSGLDMLLGATFLGVARIVVYAGAAIALLFAVVLIREAGLEAPAPAPRLRVGLKTAGAATLIGGGLLVVRLRPGLSTASAPEPVRGSVTLLEPPSIGVSLFTDHVLALETLSLIVLAAGVIAVVLVRRRATP